MSLIRNDLLQAVRHVATNACNKVEISGCPLFCDNALEFFHRLRVFSVDASLEIIPYFFDRIEIRTPGRPVEEVNTVIVEPLSACACGMDSPVVLLKPPLSTRPELMSRGDEI